jgi:hypothetical protein
MSNMLLPWELQIMEANGYTSINHGSSMLKSEVAIPVTKSSNAMGAGGAHGSKYRTQPQDRVNAWV